MFERTRIIFRANKYRLKSEPAEIDFLLKSLKAGDISVDIGGYKGAYAYWMQKAVGKTGKVYVFEPQKYFYQYLLKSRNLLGLENVVIENMAISSSKGVVTLHVPNSKTGHSPGASINEGIFKEDDLTYQVGTTSLSKYFLEKEIFPKLLKIDVEGHELKIIREDKVFFETVKPKIILECEGRHLGNNSVFDVFNELQDLGYSGKFVNGRHALPLRDFNPEIHQKSGDGRFWAKKGYCNNFLFE